MPNRMLRRIFLGSCWTIPSRSMYESALKHNRQFGKRAH